MVTGELEYKHAFVVKDGKPIFDNESMLSYFYKELEGSRGYLLVRKEEQKKTQSQLGFYFKGIIKAECKNMNEFAGMNEMQIHYSLMRELRPKQIIVVDEFGKEKSITGIEDFSEYSKSETARYITDVIIYLQDKGVNIKDPNNFAGYEKIKQPNRKQFEGW